MTHVDRVRGLPRWGGVALAVLLTACGYGVNVNAPSAADTTSQNTNDSTGGAFQRATLTVTVMVVPEDSAVAAEVGIPSHGVARAAVTIQRSGSGGSRVSDTTDASGKVTFAALVPGPYTISAIRILATNEAARLDSTDADVNAFGGGTADSVSPPGDSITVGVGAGRRGSLVISEVFAYGPRGVNFQYNEYDDGEYVELYNNADTTIYLDGKILGVGYAVDRTYRPPQTCAETAVWRDDPLGIWARFFDAFPGTGRTYPLAPGHAVVVATDAIDHTQVLSTMLNLTGADFEMHGSNDVDNPAVPNMIDIGLAEWTPSLFGHGLFFTQQPVYFVASPVNVDSLVHQNPTGSRNTYVRFPATSLLDVFTTIGTPSFEAGDDAQGFTACGFEVNTAFDRQTASLDNRDVFESMTRKVFTTLPDGRVILLRTRSSANDFEIAPPTPGKVP